MSTLVKLANGRRIIVPDSSRFARRGADRISLQLNGLGCAPCRRAAPKRFTPLGGIDFNINAKSAVGAAGGAASGASAGAALGPIGAAVGAVIGAAASLVGKKPVPQAEQNWDAYKKVANQYAGSQFDEGPFAEIIKGAFDTNKNALKGDREQFMAQIAGQIVSALKDGKISVNATAPQIYESVIYPWMVSAGKIDVGKFNAHPTMRPLFTAIIDRYINNLPITRADMTQVKGGPYNTHAPLIVEALKGWTPPGTPAATPPPASAPAPVTPAPTVSTPAPVVTTPNPAGTPLPTSPGQNATLPLPNNSATGGVDVSGLISSLMAQGASQQQAFTSAMSALQSKGVAPTSQVQAAVADQVAAAGGLPSWAIPAGIGAAGLLALLLLKKKGR